MGGRDAGTDGGHEDRQKLCKIEPSLPGWGACLSQSERPKGTPSWRPWFSLSPPVLSPMVDRRPCGRMWGLVAMKLGVWEHRAQMPRRPRRVQWAGA